MDAKVLKDILLKAQDLILRGGRNKAVNYNDVLNGINEAVEWLDGADLIDFNKVWHQAKDKMPDIYGGRYNDYLCVHKFRPSGHTHLTHEENCPEFEEYLKKNPEDWWCNVWDLLKKEHNEKF